MNQTTTASIHAACLFDRPKLRKMRPSPFGEGLGAGVSAVIAGNQVLDIVHAVVAVPAWLRLAARGGP